MKLDTTKASAFLSKYWIPILALVVLFIACQDPDPVDGRKIAKLFSGPYYKYYIAITVLFLTGLAIHRRKMRTIFWALELTLFCLVITNVLKFSLPLGRPPRMNDGVIVLGGYSPGFPSAHTAFAFGLAWLVYVLKPRYSPLWFAFAIAVGWSRVEMRAHYPYQVICGALLGILLAHLISRSLKGITQNTFTRFKKKSQSDPELVGPASGKYNPSTLVAITLIQSIAPLC